MTALSLPREVMRALRGHKAGPGKVLGYDGARPVWTPVVIPVLHGDPAVLVEGLIWFDLDATC